MEIFSYTIDTEGQKKYHQITVKPGDLKVFPEGNNEFIFDYTRQPPHVIFNRPSDYTVEVRGRFQLNNSQDGLILRDTDLVVITTSEARKLHTKIDKFKIRRQS